MSDKWNKWIINDKMLRFSSLFWIFSNHQFPLLSIPFPSLCVIEAIQSGFLIFKIAPPGRATRKIEMRGCSSVDLIL